MMWAPIDKSNILVSFVFISLDNKFLSLVRYSEIYLYSNLNSS